MINPDLRVSPGDVVQITLINGDGPEHDIALPDLGVESETVKGENSATMVIFTVDQEGTFTYYCTLPCHRQVGMEGNLISENR